MTLNSTKTLEERRTMKNDAELMAEYDELNDIENSLLSVRDEVSAMDYTEDRDTVETCLNDALELVQEAMKACNKDRFVNEH